MLSGEKKGVIPELHPLLREVGVHLEYGLKQGVVGIGTAVQAELSKVATLGNLKMLVSK